MSKLYFQHFQDVYAIYFMAFVGGFIDATGYEKLQGIFTSSITGNVVAACVSVNGSNYGILCRFLVTISFVASAALLSLLGLRLKLVNKVTEKFLIILFIIVEIIMLVGVWIVGQYYADFLNSAEATLDSAQLILVGCFMAASMGFQSIAAKQIDASAPSTTVVTTTLINNAQTFASIIAYGIAINSVKWSLKSVSKDIQLEQCSSRRDENLPRAEEYTPPTLNSISLNNHLQGYELKLQEFWKKFLGAFYPLISFIVGAIIGAVSSFHISFYCISIPIVILLFLLLEIFFKVQIDQTSPTTTVNSK